MAYIPSISEQHMPHAHAVALGAATVMDPLEGIWRLVDGRAWDEGTGRLSAPYGAHPLGHIEFSKGRMLAALYFGRDDDRGFSSYGGRYSFDGATLEVAVDVASEPARIGGLQVRGVVMLDRRQMLLRPPARRYGGAVQRRELVWERVWCPGEDDSSEAGPGSLAGVRTVSDRSEKQHAGSRKKPWTLCELLPKLKCFQGKDNMSNSRILLTDEQRARPA